MDDVQIMVHTLVEHMNNTFPNPWASEPQGHERSAKATLKETAKLVDDVDQLLVLSIKLTRQLARTHKLIGTGRMR